MCALLAHVLQDQEDALTVFLFFIFDDSFVVLKEVYDNIRQFFV